MVPTVQTPVMRILARPAFRNRDANPYNWLLYTPMRDLGVEVHEHSRWRLLTGSYDIWHLHWPESPLNSPKSAVALSRAVGLLVLMTLARRRGTKVVWTIHNLAAHEEQHHRIASWFRRAFVRRLDGYISLSVAGDEMARRRFPDLGRRPGFVVPIGHFRGWYEDRVDGRAARARLGLEPDATVLAFMGQVRPYKGVRELCDVFTNIPDERARLLVAGEAKEAQLERDLRAMARRDTRIQLHLGFVPDSDVQLYLRAADLVVLPFIKTLNSASALLALSFDRPILVPETGPLAELQQRVGTEWVRTYRGELTSKALTDALEWNRAVRRSERPCLDVLDWPELSAQTVDAFRQIRGLPRAARQDTSRPVTRPRVPRVSVVVPVYNRPAKVRRAIESVLSQTYQEFEIVVVDDGSTDDTAHAVRAIVDPRIRCIRHETRRGGSAARNTGIRASAGEFIAFLDSDDEWLPSKLESQIAVFERSARDVGLVYTGAVLQFAQREQQVFPKYRGHIVNRLLAENVVGSTSVGMVRRDVLLRVGGFDEALPAKQDADLWLRIAEHYLVDYVPMCLARIHKLPDDGRVTSATNRVAARELFLRKHREKLERSQLLHRYLRQSGRTYHRMAGDVERARQLYLESIKLRPVSPATYMFWLGTYLPDSWYAGIARCQRKLTLLLK
jgi:beta-1,4-mannosyltransferase